MIDCMADWQAGDARVEHDTQLIQAGSCNSCCRHWDSTHMAAGARLCDGVVAVWWSSLCASSMREEAHSTLHSRIRCSAARLAREGARTSASHSGGGHCSKCRTTACALTPISARLWRSTPAEAWIVPYFLLLLLCILVDSGLAPYISGGGGSRGRQQLDRPTMYHSWRCF